MILFMYPNFSASTKLGATKLFQVPTGIQGYTRKQVRTLPHHEGPVGPFF